MFWAVDDLSTGMLSDRREHVLPTGQMHLVFRLGEGRLRLFSDEDDGCGEIAGDALIGGARGRYYAREISGLQSSVGVQLHPGAAEALFGVPAGEFTGRHIPLDEVWGQQVSIIRERLAAATSLAGRLDTLEAVLAARISGTRGMHPAVARALQHFSVTSDVGRVVRESGYSHRTLISQFRRSVGLTPKEYTRVLRLQRAIRRMPRVGSLAELAAEAGYSDQAHLSREFRAFSGLTPGAYRGIAPEAPHHVRMADSAR